MGISNKFHQHEKKRQRKKATGSEFNTCCQTSFICPCAADIAHRVSSTAEQKKWFIEGLDESDTIGVP
jgi:hypothetical protein